MKKVFAIIFSGLILCSLAACGQNNGSKATESTTQAVETTAAASPTDVIAGGYTDAESPVLTDETKALFTKASEALTGVGYEPVAYLGSQVVAGTNHLILCKATPTVPDAKTTYAIVTVYEDLNGKAEITDVQNCEAEAPVSDDEEQTGAYTQSEDPTVTDDAKNALTNAVKELDGASYEAKALLATQVVAGTNYQLLCKITPVTENPVAHYAVVTVYEDLEGNAEISQAAEFSAASDAESNAEDNAESDTQPQAETSQG